MNYILPSIRTITCSLKTLYCCDIRIQISHVEKWYLFLVSNNLFDCFNNAILKGKFTHVFLRTYNHIKVIFVNCVDCLGSPVHFTWDCELGRYDRPPPNKTFKLYKWIYYSFPCREEGILALDLKQNAAYFYGSMTVNTLGLDHDFMGLSCVYKYTE